jgi:acetyl-CoA carboxylase carboxyltransferase component
LLDIVPESRSQVYDMRRVIEVLADASSMFELKARYGRSLTTSLIRLDGHPCGVLANNPYFKGGAIDVDACAKATDFLVLCDSFNLPVVLLVDQPGFLVGIEGEKRGAAGRIINWMNALSLVTVPKVSIILRKSYGQAYLNMGGGRNSDVVACWPTADLGFMDPRVGSSVLGGKDQDEIARDTLPWGLAALFETQAVIDPRETRDWLVRTLRLLRSKLTGGVGQHRLANWPTSY